MCFANEYSEENWVGPSGNLGCKSVGLEDSSGEISKGRAGGKVDRTSS